MALQEHQFGTVALSLYAVVDDSGCTVATFPGLTRKATEFLAFLETANAPRSHPAAGVVATSR